MLSPKSNLHDTSEPKMCATCILLLRPSTHSSFREITKTQIIPTDPPLSLTPLRNLFPQYIRKYSIHIKQEDPIDVMKYPEPMELDQPSRSFDATSLSSAFPCSNCGCALEKPVAGLVCDTCLTVLDLAPLNEAATSSATWSEATRSENHTPSLHGVKGGRVSKTSRLRRSSSSSDWSTRPCVGSLTAQPISRKSQADKERKAQRGRKRRGAIGRVYQLFEEFIKDNGWQEKLKNFTLNRNNHNKSGLFASTLVVLETTYDMLISQKDKLSKTMKERHKYQTFIQQATERIPRDVWEKYGMFGDLVNLNPSCETVPSSTTSVLLYFTPEPTASPQPDPQPPPHPSKL